VGVTTTATMTGATTTTAKAAGRQPPSADRRAGTAIPAPSTCENWTNAYNNGHGNGTYGQDGNIAGINVC